MVMMFKIPFLVRLVILLSFFFVFLTTTTTTTTTSGMATATSAETSSRGDDVEESPPQQSQQQENVCLESSSSSCVEKQSVDDDDDDDDNMGNNKKAKTKTKKKKKKTVLVVGATGATGKHVVRMLLERGDSTVRVVVRSEERLKSVLTNMTTTTTMNMDDLEVTEAPIHDLSDDALESVVSGCDVVVSCLGHSITFEGIWGEPRRLVTDSVRRLARMMLVDGHSSTKKIAKFILMGSNGVIHPMMTMNDDDDDDNHGITKSYDRPRTMLEGFIIGLIRYLVPPHADNEDAASHLVKTYGPYAAINKDERTSSSSSSSSSSSQNTGRTLEWTIVRPGDLVEHDVVTPYDLHERSPRGPFGDGSVSRINVADFIVRLISDNDDDLWNSWKFRLPVILFASDGDSDAKTSTTNKK